MPSPEPFLLLGAVFGDPDLGELFSERALVESWLQVERMLAAVQAEFEIIPREAAALIEVEAVFEKVNLERLREGTRRVGYPIVPLIEQITAGSPESSAIISTGEPPPRTSWTPGSCSRLAAALSGSRSSSLLSDGALRRPPRRIGRR